MKSLLPVLAALALPTTAFASFHLMQIEQVIGSVDGDTTAQAIQLRMRVGGQNAVSEARIRAWDAAGANPVILRDMSTNVANSAAGSRILLATPAFLTKVRQVTPGFTADFSMAPIPASYLAAGRLTFQSDANGILWSLAWGGADYTGSNSGFPTNDADSNFGPAFGKGLPRIDRRALRFTGDREDESTTNAADYKLTGIPAKVTNNAGQSSFIGPRPELAIYQPAGTPLVDGKSKRDFGSVVNMATGPTKTFTLKNIGSANIELGNVFKTGPAKADFKLTFPPATILAPGATTSMTVTFTPSAPGLREAALHFRSNDANEDPFDIDLSGTGIAR